MALIYIERLMRETHGRLCLRHYNWRSVLFACLVMASKVWDDLSMWNVDFSHVCPSFDLQRVNSLELTMLEELRYFIKVSAGEYAKYYFLLRSMTVKLGMGQGLGSSPGSPSGDLPSYGLSTSVSVSRVYFCESFMWTI